MKQLQQTLSSLEVAEMIEKPHKNLLRSIGTYQQHFSQLNFESADYFQETSYTDEQGKSRKCYNITKKGCELIANKLTGIKGTEFTVKFIERFHQMEQILQQQPQIEAKPTQKKLPQRKTDSRKAYFLHKITHLILVGFLLFLFTFSYIIHIKNNLLFFIYLKI